MREILCYECEVCGTILKDKQAMARHEAWRGEPYTVGQTVYHHHTEMSYGDDVGRTYEMTVIEVAPCQHVWAYRTDSQPCDCPSHEGWWEESELRIEEY